MSKKKQGLLIAPPLFLTDTNEESEVFSGYTCPVCLNNGKVPDHKIINVVSWKLCPFCGGTKKIKAVVTIKWLPDSNNQ